MGTRRSPLFIEVKEKMLAALRSTYQPGDQLPSQSCLAEQYGASRVTVREVLRALEQEGMVVTRHGLGTFVTSDLGVFCSSINVLQSCTEMARAQGVEFSTEVLALHEIEPNEKICGALGLTPADRVVELKRVRSVGREPRVYSVDIFPRTLVNCLAADRFSKSLFQVLEQDSHTRIVRSYATISPAGPRCEAARFMALPDDVFLLLFEQIHYDDKGKAVLFSLDYYRGDRFKFTVVRKRL